MCCVQTSDVCPPQTGADIGALEGGCHVITLGNSGLMYQVHTHALVEL